MYRFFRPLLFKLDPETAHALTLLALRISGALPPVNWVTEQIYKAPPKPVSAFGLTFKNPVGLAAGYDKDGIAIRGLAALGFSHLEIGTVTPRPQEGNPKPRLFRLVEDKAVINRMGFPGKGAEFVAVSLRATVGSEAIPSPIWRLLHRVSIRRKSRLLDTPHNDTIIGVNLSKNKDTPLENAAEDYISLMRTFAPLADYLVINVSSPNTIGLRRLQGREMLGNLLSRVSEERGTWRVKRPVLVKLSPDLTEEELDDALDVILSTGMDGIIATNTTLGRAGLRSRLRVETGGLSGEPLRGRSEAVLAQVVKKVEGQIPVISVGGIMSPDDAKRRLDMGASLVHIYTGLIYTGPGLVQAIIRAV